MQGNSATPFFSLRIVSLDNYMATPSDELAHGLGIDASRTAYGDSVVGATEPVQRWPVVRIYGATPAGQKALLHLHGSWPYFYVLWPEALPADGEETDRFLHSFGCAVERAIEVSESVANEDQQENPVGGAEMRKRDQGPRQYVRGGMTKHSSPRPILFRASVVLFLSCSLHVLLCFRRRCVRRAMDQHIRPPPGAPRLSQD